MSDYFVEVVLPIALRHSLIYRVPPSLKEKAQPGHRVQVPIGSRSAIGCVLREVPKPTHLSTKELKDIQKILDDQPILSAAAVDLLSWASAYYLTSPGEVLRHLLPPSLLKGKASRSPRKLPLESSEFRKERVLLTSEQKKVVETIRKAFSDNPSKPVLLHGVTGSGKTEIYLEIVEEIVSQKSQVLILVPEIGLTPQLFGRFQSLGVPARAYHSGLTEAQRFQIWQEVRENKISIVIATRSGIFLPFQNLKAIVVDEEHDASYKQEERFCYHARDLALWKGVREKIVVLLGSATPSVETFQRARQEKIELVSLTTRPGEAKPPLLKVIDLRNRKEEDPFLSVELQDALSENLRKKEQSLLFLNRRGFSPFVLCPTCGFVPHCGQCHISFTLHRHQKEKPTLVCHYCDDSSPYQPICSKCGKGTMTFQGYGTERVASELMRLFPSAKVARLDRDTGKSFHTILEKMKKKEIDILVGTQMITKGHDYPDLTLVGILDADLSLNIPDFRAEERTFQLITQVSGRAGRASKPGKVLIQTYRPDHPSLQAVLSANSFQEMEIKNREESHYPPFVRLIQIRVSGSSGSKVKECSRQLADLLAPVLTTQAASLLGPAPCPLEMLRGKTRWHVLIKTTRYAKLQPQLQKILKKFLSQMPSSLRLLVNVDPVDLA